MHCLYGEFFVAAHLSCVPSGDRLPIAVASEGTHSRNIIRGVEMNLRMAQDYLHPSIRRRAIAAAKFADCVMLSTAQTP